MSNTESTPRDLIIESTNTNQLLEEPSVDHGDLVDHQMAALLPRLQHRLPPPHHLHALLQGRVATAHPRERVEGHAADLGRYSVVS